MCETDSIMMLNGELCPQLILQAYQKIVKNLFPLRISRSNDYTAEI